MEARYAFEVGEDSLKGIQTVLSGLESIEAQTKSTAKAAGSANLGKKYAMAANEISKGMAGADRQVAQVGHNTRQAVNALKPMKAQLRAVKAEARLVDFGGLTDTRQFQKATKELGKYKAEIKAIRTQVEVTTQAEREFTATLKHQERVMAKRIQMAKTQRQAAIAAEKKGKALGLTAAGAAVAAPVAAVGRKGTSLLIDYGDALSETQAITRATDAEMKIIDRQAKKMGATTRFTSSESAKAMSYLGMAGFKTQEILESVGDTLNLAAAGHLDLAKAADIGSNVLSGFNLKAKEMSRVANVMAKVATTANTSVAQMGEAMAYAAPAASMFGASLEEASAMVGIGGNIGIQASSAGTALRAGFVNLAKADKQAKLKNVFGVEVVDQLTHANRNIIDIIGDIKNSMDVDFRDPQFIKDLQRIQERMDSGELGPDAYDRQISALKRKYPQYSAALAGLADVFGKTAVSFWAGQITQYEQLTHDSVQALAAGLDPDILTQALKQSGLEIRQNEDVFSAVLRIAPDYKSAANVIDRASREIIASGRGGAGAVEAMAHKMKDNLGGSFRAMNSAIEFMLLNVMEPLVPIMRGAAWAVGWAARQIGALPGPIRTAISMAAGLVVVIGSLVAIAGAAGVAMFGFQQYLATTTIAMQVMSRATLPLTGFFAEAMKAFSLRGMLGMLGAIASFGAPILAVATAVVAVAYGAKFLYENLETVVELFKDYREDISTALASVANFFKSVREAIARARAMFIAFADKLTGGTFSVIVKSISEFISKTVLLRVALAAVFEVLTIHTGFVLLKTAMQGVTWVLTDLSSRLQEFKPEWDEKLQPVLKVLRAVTNTLIRIDTQLDTFMGNLLHRQFVIAGLKIQMAWTRAIDYIQGLFKGWVESAKNIGQQLINALNHNPTERIPEAWDRAVAFITNRMNDMVEFAQWAGTAISKPFRDAWTNMQQWYQTSDQAEQMKTSLQNTVNPIREVGNQFIDAIMNPKETGKAIGKRLGEMTIEGVRTSLKALSEAIVNIGRTAIKNLGITGGAALISAVLLAIGLPLTTITVGPALAAVELMLPLLLAGLSAAGVFQKVDKFLIKTIGHTLDKLFGEDNQYVQRVKQSLEWAREQFNNLFEWIGGQIPEGGILVLIGIAGERFLKGVGQAFQVAQDLAKRVGPIFSQFVNWIKTIEFSLSGLKFAARQAFKYIVSVGQYWLDSLGPFGWWIQDAIGGLARFAGIILTTLRPALALLKDKLILPLVKAIGNLVAYLGELPLVQMALRNIGKALAWVVESPLVKPLLALGASAIANLALSVLTGARWAGGKAKQGYQAVRAGASNIAQWLQPKMDFTLRTLMEINRGVWAGVKTTVRTVGRVPGLLGSIVGTIGRLIMSLSPLGFLTRKSLQSKGMTPFDFFLKPYEKQMKLRGVMERRPTGEFTDALMRGQDTAYIDDVAGRMKPFQNILRLVGEAALGSNTAWMLLVMNIGLAIGVVGTAVAALGSLAFGLYVFKPELFKGLVKGLKSVGQAALGVAYIFTHLGREVTASFDEAGKAFYEFKILGLKFKAPKWAAYLTKGLNIAIAVAKGLTISLVGVIDTIAKGIGYIVKLFAAAGLALSWATLQGLKGLKASLEWIYFAVDRLGFAIESSIRARSFKPLVNLFWGDLLKPLIDSVGRALNKAWSAFTSWFGRTVNAIGQWIKTVPLMWLKSLGNAIGAGFMSLLDLVWKGLEKIGWGLTHIDKILIGLVTGAYLIKGLSILVAWWAQLGGAAVIATNIIGAAIATIAALVAEYRSGFPVIRTIIHGLTRPIETLERVTNALTNFLEKPFNPLESLFSLITNGFDEFGGTLKALIPILLVGYGVFKVMFLKKGIFGGVISAIGDIVGIFTTLVKLIFQASKAMVGFGRASRESYDSYEGRIGSVNRSELLYRAGFVPEDGPSILGVDPGTRGRRISNEMPEVQEFLGRNIRDQKAIQTYLNLIKKEIRKEEKAYERVFARKLSQTLEEMSPLDREKLKRGSRVKVGKSQVEYEKGRFGWRLTSDARRSFRRNATQDTAENLGYSGGEGFARLAKQAGYTSSIEDWTGKTAAGTTELQEVADLLLGTNDFKRQKALSDLQGWPSTNLEEVRRLSIEAHEVVLTGQNVPLFEKRTLAPDTGRDKLLNVDLSEDMVRHWASKTGKEFEGKISATFRQIERYFDSHPEQRRTIRNTPANLFASLARTIVPEESFESIAKFPGGGNIPSGFKYSTSEYARGYEEADKASAHLAILQAMGQDVIPFSGTRSKGRLNDDFWEMLEPQSSSTIMELLKSTIDERKKKRNGLSQGEQLKKDLQDTFAVLRAPGGRGEELATKLVKEIQNSGGNVDKEKMVRPLQREMLRAVFESNPVIEILKGYDQISDEILAQVELEEKRLQKKGIIPRLQRSIMRGPIGDLVTGVQGLFLPRRMQAKGKKIAESRKEKLRSLVPEDYAGNTPGSKTKSYVTEVALKSGNSFERMVLDSIASSAANTNLQSEYVKGIVSTIATTPDKNLKSYEALIGSTKDPDALRKKFPEDAYDRISAYAEKLGYGGEDRRQTFFNLLKRGLLDVPGLQKGQERRLPSDRKSDVWYDKAGKPRDKPPRKEPLGAYDVPRFGDSLANILVGQAKIGELAPGVKEYKGLMTDYGSQINAIRNKNFEELRRIDSEMYEVLKAQAYKRGDSAESGMRKLFNMVHEKSSQDSIFGMLRGYGAIEELSEPSKIKEFLETTKVKSTGTLALLRPLLSGEYSDPPNDIYARILREIARANQIEVDELIDPSLVKGELLEARQLRIKKLNQLAGVASDQAFMKKTGIDRTIYDQLISGKIYQLDEIPGMIRHIAETLGVNSAEELERIIASRNLLDEYDTVGRRIAKALAYLPKKMLAATGISGIAEQQIYKSQLRNNVLDIERRIKDRDTAEIRLAKENLRLRQQGLASIMVRLDKSEKQLYEELSKEGLKPIFEQFMKTGSWEVSVPMPTRKKIATQMQTSVGGLESLVRYMHKEGIQDKFIDFLNQGTESTYKELGSHIEELRKRGFKLTSLDDLKSMRIRLEDSGSMDALKQFIKRNDWKGELENQQKNAIAKILDIEKKSLSENLASEIPKNLFARRVNQIRNLFLNLDTAVDRAMDTIEGIPVVGGQVKNIRPRVDAATKRIKESAHAVREGISGAPLISSALKIFSEHRKMKGQTLQGLYQKSGINSLSQFVYQTRSAMLRQGLKEGDADKEILEILGGKALGKTKENTDVRGKTHGALKEVLNLTDKEFARLETGQYSAEAVKPFIFFLGEHMPRLMLETTLQFTGIVTKAVLKGAKAGAGALLKMAGGWAGKPLSALAVRLGHWTGDAVQRVRTAFPDNKLLMGFERALRRLGIDSRRWIQEKTKKVENTRKNIFQRAWGGAVKLFGIAVGGLLTGFLMISQKVFQAGRYVREHEFKLGPLFNSLQQALGGFFSGIRNALGSLKDRLVSGATRRISGMKEYRARSLAEIKKQQANAAGGYDTTLHPTDPEYWRSRGFFEKSIVGPEGKRQTQWIYGSTITPITERLKQSVGNLTGNLLQGAIDAIESMRQPSFKGILSGLNGIWGSIRGWLSRTLSKVNESIGKNKFIRQYRENQQRLRTPPTRGRGFGGIAPDVPRKKEIIQSARDKDAGPGTRTALTSMAHRFLGGKDIETADVFSAGFQAIRIAASKTFQRIGSGAAKASQSLINIFNQGFSRVSLFARGMGDNFRLVMKGVNTSGEIAASWLANQFIRRTQRIRGAWQGMKQNFNIVMKALKVSAELTGKWVQSRLSENSPGPTYMIRKHWGKTAGFVIGQFKQMVSGSARAGKSISGNLIAAGGKRLLGGLGGIAKTGMLAGGAFMGLGFGAQQIASSLQTLGIVDDRTSEALYKFTEIFSLISGIGAVIAPVIGLVASGLGTILSLVGGVLALGGGLVTFVFSPVGLAIAGVVAGLFLINEVLKRTLGIDAIGPIFGAVKSLAMDTASTLFTAFTWAADWVVMAWEGFRDKFWPILQPIVEPALNIAQQLINALNHNPTERIPEAWDWAVTQIVGFLQSLPIVGQMIGSDMTKIFDPAIILGSLVDGFGAVYSKIIGFFGIKNKGNPLEGILAGWKRMEKIDPADLALHDVSDVLERTRESMQGVSAAADDLASLENIRLKSFVRDKTLWDTGTGLNVNGVKGGVNAMTLDAPGRSIMSKGDIKKTLKTAPEIVSSQLRAVAAKEKLTGGKDLLGGGLGDKRRLAEAKYATKIAKLKQAEDIVAHKRQYDDATVKEAERTLKYKRQEMNRIKQDARKELGAFQLSSKQQNFLMDTLGLDPDAVEAGINRVMTPMQNLAWSWRDHMSAMKRSGNDFWEVAGADFRKIGRGFRGLTTNFLGSSLIILGALGSLIMTMLAFGVSSILAMGPVGVAISLVLGLLLILSVKTLGLRGTFDLLWKSIKTAFRGVKLIFQGIIETYKRISNGVTILGATLRTVIQDPKKAWGQFLGLLKKIQAQILRVMQAVGSGTVTTVRNKVQSDVQRVADARDAVAQGKGVKGKIGGAFRSLFGKNKPTAETLPGGTPTPSATAEMKDAVITQGAAATAKARVQQGRTGSTGGVAPAMKQAADAADEAATATGKAEKSFSDLSDVTLTLAAAFGPFAPAIAGPLFVITSVMDGVMGLVEGLPILKGIFNDNILPVIQKAWAGITTKVFPALKQWAMGNKVLMSAFGAVKGAFLTHIWPIMASMWGWVSANVIAPVAAWIASLFGLSFSSATAGATTTASNAAIAGSTAGAAGVVVPASLSMAGAFRLLGAAAGKAWAIVTAPISLVILGIAAVIGAIWLLAKRFKWIGKLFSPITNVIKLFWGVTQQVMDDIKRMVNLAFLEELSKIGQQLRELGRIILKPFEPLFNLLGIKGGGSNGGIIGQAIYVLVQAILLPIRVMALGLIGIIKVVSFLIQGFILLGKIIAWVIVAPIVFIQEVFSKIFETAQNIVKTLTSPIINMFAGLSSWIMGGRERRERRSRGYAKGGYVGYDTGGMVRGSGSAVSDSIHALLSNGEFVMPTAVTRQNRSVLEMMRSGVPVEAILRALPVTHPIPRDLLDRNAAMSDPPEPAKQEINVNITFGDIHISGGGDGREQAQEFMQTVEPQIQRAIADTLRDLLEKTR